MAAHCCTQSIPALHHHLKVSISNLFCFSLETMLPYGSLSTKFCCTPISLLHHHTTFVTLLPNGSISSYTILSLTQTFSHMHSSIKLIYLSPFSNHICASSVHIWSERFDSAPLVFKPSYTANALLHTTVQSISSIIVIALFYARAATLPSSWYFNSTIFIFCVDQFASVIYSKHLKSFSYLLKCSISNLFAITHSFHMNIITKDCTEEDELLKSDSEDNSLSKSVAQISIEGIEKLADSALSRIIAIKKSTANDTTAVSTPLSPICNSVSNSTFNVTPKRKIDSPSPPPIQKKAKIMSPPSFADIARKKKDLFVIDIIPDEDDLLLTTEHCKLIKASYTKALFQSEQIADLDFEFTGFDNGRLRVICENELSKKWIIETLPLLTDLWKDANLKPIDVGAPPKLLRTTFSLPYPTPEPPALFDAIKRQNRTIDTSTWRVYNRKRGQNDRQNWIIGIDSDSAAAIKILNSRVKFGMDRIRFSVDNDASNGLSK